MSMAVCLMTFFRRRRGHTKLARRRGATDEQIMEAIWVAAEMRAGGAYAHAAIALDALVEGGGSAE